MTKVRDLRDGDEIDLRKLPYEVDLDEHPLIEFQNAVVDSVEPDWTVRPDGAPSEKMVIHTDEHGSWAVDPDFEFEVLGRVRR